MFDPIATEQSYDLSPNVGPDDDKSVDLPHFQTRQSEPFLKLILLGSLTKNFKVRYNSITPENIFQRVKSTVGSVYVKEMTYTDVDGSTITLRWGDTEGAYIFLSSKALELTLHSKQQSAGSSKRKVRVHEELGKVEKDGMNKDATFTQLDYLRYSRNKQLYSKLKSDRGVIMDLTGVYSMGTCILSRCCIVCPLCSTSLSPRHGGGLECLISHLASTHKTDPLGQKIVGGYRTKEFLHLDQYEKDRIKKDWSTDLRYCNLKVVEDLKNGSRSSLESLPKRSAADFFLPQPKNN